MSDDFEDNNDIVTDPVSFADLIQVNRKKHVNPMDEVAKDSMAKLFPSELPTLRMVTNINNRQVAGLVRIEAIKSMFLPEAGYLDDIVEAAVQYNISKSRGGRNDIVSILRGIFSSRDDEYDKKGLMSRFTGKK